VAETTHDCGELGGLAQSRKRFLLVARHIEKVPPFLYEPDKKRLQAVGDRARSHAAAGRSAAGGPMHRIPRLQWKTWVRLAFVEAGSDWRSLNRLAVEDGVLRDYLIVPEYRSGYLGVNRWNEAMGTVAGRSSPTNGAFSIADPRAPAGALEYQQYGVCGWQDTMGSVINVKSPGQGTFSIADPRRAGEGFGKYMVTRYDEAAGTVISSSTTGQGAYAVADPRPNGIPEHGDHYLTGGHYGVTRWDQSTGAVSSAACHDNGRWSVADPRMPEPGDKLVAVIRALDGTWHRPFTTLELAALQSLIEPEEYLELDGLSDSGWRERIGNAVPPSAAAAIAGVMGTTLLLAWSGETFMLSASPIWVRPVAVAISVAQVGAT
jgi:site-specific DNA-cytosine methylase